MTVDQGGSIGQKQTSPVLTTATQGQALGAKDCIMQADQQQLLLTRAGLKPNSGPDLCTAAGRLKNTETLRQVLVAIARKGSELERLRPRGGEADSAAYAKQAADLDPLLVQLRTEVRIERWSRFSVQPNQVG